MIYDKNAKEMQAKVLERLQKYTGQEFETCRYSNPNITKREAIYIADYISSLENKISDLNDVYEMEARYGDK